MRKINNRGISLVELVIVITIMAIAASFVGWGVSTMSGKPAQQCSQKIVYALERGRMTAMGRSEAYFKLYITTDKKVMFEEGFKQRVDDASYAVTTTEVGSNRVTVLYEDATGGINTLGPGSSLEFRFDRGSGAFDKNHFPCKKLIIRSGRNEVNINLVQITGKVYLD